jgi:hypothetical protein
MSAALDTALPDVPAPAGPSKTYRFTPGWRVFMAAFFSVILAGCLWGFFGITLADDVPLERKLMADAVVVAFAAATVWQLVIFLTWQVRLSDDAIETSTWWRTRKLRRDEIAGARINSTRQAGSILLLVPKDAGGKRMTLALRYIKKDAAFGAWFSNLTDLNAVDLQQSVASIAQNAAYGATPEERLLKLNRARKVARSLDFVMIAVVLWSFIDPRPYPYVIASLAALPIIALILVATSRGLYRIGIGATAAHANVGSVCAVPAFALLARVPFDFNLVDWMPPIAAAAACAAIFVIVTAVADRSLRTRRWMLLGLGLVTGAYAFGVIGEADALLDRSQVTVLRSQVLDKHITYGRAKTYHLKLAPWGPMSEGGDVSVAQAVYDRLEAGSTACIVLRSGALGMPWFIVLACR